MEKYQSLILLSVLLLAACQREQDLSWRETPISIRASASSTRTFFSAQADKVSVEWTDDDTIGVWCSTSVKGNFPYVAIVDDSDRSSAKFEAASPGRIFYYDGSAATYYAYLPYRSSNGDTPDISFSLPSLQIQVSGGDAGHLADSQPFRANPVQVSNEDAQVDFSFVPLLSTVRLSLVLGGSENVRVPIRKIKLISSDAPLCASKVSLNLEQGDAPMTIEDGEQEVTLLFDTMPVIDLDTGADAYLTVLPGAFTQGIEVELTAVDGSIAKSALPAVTFLAGHSYSRSLSPSVSDFISTEPFDVSPSTLTISAGDELSFTIHGTANSIDFWSGEKFHDYAYSKEHRIEKRPLYMSFKHALSAGTQNNHPYVKVSSDFNGKMTEEAILSATWTDISDKFTFADNNPGSSNPLSSLANYEKYFVDSGEYDLSGLFESVDSLYIAFFWHVEKFDEELQNTRTASYLTRFRVGDDWEMSQTNLSLVWNEENWIGTSHPSWQTPKTSAGVPDYPAFRFFSDFRPSSDQDAYALTCSPFGASFSDYGFDTPFTVQGEGEQTPSSFSYTFTEPGTYQLVFSASCPTLAGAKTEIRRFTINVN